MKVKLKSFEPVLHVIVASLAILKGIRSVSFTFFPVNDFGHRPLAFITFIITVLLFYGQFFYFLHLFRKRKKLLLIALGVLAAHVASFLILKWVMASGNITNDLAQSQELVSAFERFVNWKADTSQILRDLVSTLMISLSYAFIIFLIRGQIGQDVRLANSNKERSIGKYAEPFANAIIVMLFYVFFILGSPEFAQFGNAAILTIQLAIFYLHTLVLIPELLLKKKVLHYGMVTTFSVLLGYFASRWLWAEALSILFRQPDAEKSRSPEYLFNAAWDGREEYIISLVMLIIFSSLYYFIRNSIKGKDKFGRKKEAELKLLKSQVNPHFIFNSLNTLYAYALKGHSLKTAESIAKLANLIRYMLDDINQNFIPLKNEIGYIKDYIAIQSVRSALKHEISLEFGKVEGYVIAPILLIPFVENAFKYGMNPDEKSILVINLFTEGSRIHFKIRNSYNEKFKSFYKERGFGIGINNVKSRLALLYPHKHKLEISKSDGFFTVQMEIDTK